MATLRKSTSPIVAVWVPDHENDEGTGVKSTDLTSLKPKKKCCRSKPRCKRCPLVLHKVHKAELTGIRGKELEKVFKRARKA
ncbi:hypothetical protein BH09ACT7_BH09ACT7_48190 [soil metagenome]